MNRKNILLCLLSLLIISSCTKQPKCDSDESKKVVKGLIIQNMKKNSGILLSMYELDGDRIIKNFVNENVELINVRATEKNDELKKCGCTSQISFKLSDKLIKKFEAENNGNLIIDPVKAMKTKQIDFDFTLQIINNDKDLYVEGIVPSENLNEILMYYLTIVPDLEKKDYEDDSKNSTD